MLEYCRVGIWSWRFWVNDFWKFIPQEGEHQSLIVYLPLEQKIYIIDDNNFGDSNAIWQKISTPKPPTNNMRIMVTNCSNFAPNIKHLLPRFSDAVPLKQSLHLLNLMSLREIWHMALIHTTFVTIHITWRPNTLALTKHTPHQAKLHRLMTVCA